MSSEVGSDENTIVGQHIKLYLLERVPQFRRLTKLREKGWGNPAGDQFFKKQRQRADKASDRTACYFFEMMKGVGREIHSATGLFHIRTPDGGPSKILDMCMAPGPKTAIDFLDINMLAADMGVEVVPPEHPDTHNFLPRLLHPEDVFDLVLCDGQVLRMHSRAEYREKREAVRLTLTQLVIALEHVKPGGTILALIHKVKSWKCVFLLQIFCKFSSVQVFKPKRGHAKRSSCYLTWKQLWKTATFKTEEKYKQLVRSLEPNVKEILDDFGPMLVKLGRAVWETQAATLAKAPFVRNAKVD
ncbi:hypothetical protein HD806DRAFT_551575 [Xylariaceae sp. AK1471]|nr:hypothetical protein HD806DRAFT_551575 [Xylariaceae sp. AK1471]